MTLYNPFNLNNPYVTRVLRDDPENQIIITSTDPGIATVTQSRDLPAILYLDDNSDHIIELPDILDLTSLYISGGRNVQIIGGHLNAVQSPINGNGNTNGLLAVHNQKQNVFLEGLILDCKGFSGLDGLRIGAWVGGGRYPAYYIQNSKIVNVNHVDGDPVHADCIQINGETIGVHLHNVDLRSSGQAFLFDKRQYNSGLVELENVSTDYTDPTNGTAFSMYLRQTIDEYAADLEFKHGIIDLKNVYVGARTNTGGGLWENNSVFPDAGRSDGAVRVGDTVSWPNAPDIKGTINLRVSEEFCPASAGVGYIRT